MFGKDIDGLSEIAGRLDFDGEHGIEWRTFIEGRCIILEERYRGSDGHTGPVIRRWGISVTPLE